MSYRLSIPPVRLCGRAKRRHHTRAEALGTIAFLRSIGRHQPERGDLRDYWCRDCQAYHIGHAQSEGGL